jgi:predicted DNA-binding protein YlxM (UPF0122 family)
MTLTDEALRDEIAQGLKPAQIAAKYGLSRQAVHQRVKRLSLTTTGVASVAPLESRQFVKTQLDAMEELVHSLQRVKRLMDACDTWLRDARDPEKYDIGARSSEILVTYYDIDDDGKARKAKQPLDALLQRVERGGLQVDRSEFRHSDPRELILKTAQEVRQIVATAADLARMLADARAMQAFREALLAEIATVRPETAHAISEQVRRFLVFHAATGGPEALSPRS